MRYPALRLIPSQRPSPIADEGCEPRTQVRPRAPGARRFRVLGTTVAEAAVSALAAVVVPLAIIVLWGTFAAPNAQHRLSRATRIPFELAVFALAAGALLAAGAEVPAAGFAALVLFNSMLLTRFDQWDH